MSEAKTDSVDSLRIKINETGNMDSFSYVGALCVAKLHYL